MMTVIATPSATQGSFRFTGPVNAQALRRALLNLEGLAVTAFAITTKAGRAQHWASELSGVSESVPDVQLELANVRFTADSTVSFPRTVRANCSTPGPFTASAFEGDGVRVLTPSIVLLTLQPGADVTIELTIERGHGYSGDDRQVPAGTIALGALFSPVLNADFTPGGDGVRIDCTTDGSLTPLEAVQRAIEALATE